jgi:hypothetical protein
MTAWDLLGQSLRLVDIAPGWRGPQWVEAIHADGTHPPMRVRVELAGNLPVVTKLTLGDGSGPVDARQIGAIAPDLSALAADIMSAAAQRSRPDAPALTFSRRTRAPDGQAHEDEMLAKWEGYYQPRGYSQRHMASIEGPTVPTLRSYLSRARKRRAR